MKLALDAKSVNRQLYKNKYQMPNVDELIDGVSQAQTELKSRAQHDQELDINAKSYKPPKVEVDLTAESPSDSPEVSVIGKKKKQLTILGRTNFVKRSCLRGKSG